MKPSETSNRELHEHIEEVIDLQTTFLSMLADAMHDGVDHGYRGKWRDQSFDEHLDHAIMHLLALKYPREDDEENHLDHACFRIVAAGTVIEGEHEKDSDDVDRWESEGGADVGRSEAMGDSVSSDQAGQPRQYYFGQQVDHESKLGLRPSPGTFSTAGETKPKESRACEECGHSHPAVWWCRNTAMRGL